MSTNTQFGVKYCLITFAKNNIYFSSCEESNEEKRPPATSLLSNTAASLNTFISPTTDLRRSKANAGNTQFIHRRNWKNHHVSSKYTQTTKTWTSTGIVKFERSAKDKPIRWVFANGSFERASLLGAWALLNHWLVHFTIHAAGESDELICSLTT